MTLKKTKIFFYADIEDRKYEGRSQTSLEIKRFLEKNGFEFVDHPSKADLIQIHSSGIANSFQAARWKEKYKVPVVYSLYSLSKTEPWNHFRNHFAQRYYLRPRKTSFLLSYSAVLPLRWRTFLLKKIDLVITPSYSVQKRLFNNSKVIRIGINTKKFLPLNLPRDADQVREGYLKVGYFGHPSAYKGLLDFVRASRILSSEGYECRAYLSDTTPKMINNLQKINPLLKIYGYTSDLTKAYNQMDIIILPYRSHLAGVANPLVLLEAMACGKAIITTNFSYLQEIVKDSALIIKPYSPKEIIKAVNKLKQNELRETLGKKAREIIEVEFNQERMFEEYLQIYKELLTNTDQKKT